MAPENLSAMGPVIEAHIKAPAQDNFGVHLAEFANEHVVRKWFSEDCKDRCVNAVIPFVGIAGRMKDLRIRVCRAQVLPEKTAGKIKTGAIAFEQFWPAFAPAKNPAKNEVMNASGKAMVFRKFTIVKHRPKPQFPQSQIRGNRSRATKTGADDIDHNEPLSFLPSTSGRGWAAEQLG